jgi:hypothetical protein
MTIYQAITYIQGQDTHPINNWDFKLASLIINLHKSNGRIELIPAWNYPQRIPTKGK